MAKRIHTQYFNNRLGSLSTASTNVLFGPVDVSHYPRLSVQIVNDHTSIDLIGVKAQWSLGSSDYVDIPNGTLPALPATIGSATSILTSQIQNVANWIRILGGVSTTASANIRLYVKGYTEDY